MDVVLEGAWRLERNHLIRVQHLAAQYDAMTHFQILPFIQASVTSQQGV